MASGFPGSGRAEFYAGGRSVDTGNGSRTPSEPPLYRTNNLPGIQLDHLGNRTGAGIGKRSLADFQAAHHIQNTPAVNPNFFRSVRHRALQNVPSHMYPFGNNHGRVTNDLSLLSGGFSQRYRFPVFQQLRTQSGMSSSGSGIGFESFLNPVQNPVRTGKDSEGLNMMNRLKELEKQLLDDDDDNRDEGDAVSVITNSEWSETIQNLVVTPSLIPNQNHTPSLVSSSPASSSSSSSSVASPASLCSRQTVMEIATAVSEGNTDSAAEILARVSPNGGKSERKLMELMLHALRLRVNPVVNPVPVLEMYGDDHLESIQLMYELSPCFKLGFMAANLAILEAVLDPASENGFHVVDFDVGKGGQYVNLVHALSAREFNSTVKITAVVDRDGGGGDEDRLKDVGESLTQLADQHGVRLVFKVSSLRLSDLSRDSLGCDSDEPLAVNLAFRMFRVPDESVCTENPRDALLRRVKGLAPRVMTLVEQEMNANTAPLVARVGEACNYYGALLDSVESTVPAGNPDRVKVEEALGRKIANTVACEGADRTERCEVFGKWRVRMNMAGFELMPMSQAISESITSRLSNGNRIHRGFTVKEDNGGVCFGWMGRNLTVASAWR